MPPPNDIVEQIVIGEAAGEGEEGLRFVAEIMANRRREGRTMQDVATAPAQFSAYNRPDLTDFYLRQPQELRDYARQVIQDVQQPDYQAQYPGIEHYVTTDLWGRRGQPGVASWISKMKDAGTIGRHTALIEDR